VQFHVAWRGAWYQGKTASNVYDTRFSAGPAVPGLRDYVPQGVATWHNWDAAGRDLLVISSYRDGGGRAGLFGIDAGTGKHVGTVAIAPTHAGGIAITKGWAFVQARTPARSTTCASTSCPSCAAR
jgi:hypothetical protein